MVHNRSWWGVLGPKVILEGLKGGDELPQGHIGEEIPREEQRPQRITVTGLATIGMEVFLHSLQRGRGGKFRTEGCANGSSGYEYAPPDRRTLHWTGPLDCA